MLRHMSCTIRPVAPADRAEWLRMRRQLWPGTAEAHGKQLDIFFSVKDRFAETFVAERPSGALGGFLEAGARSYAEGCGYRTFSQGCREQPVAYIEGWYVDADLRGGGVGAALVKAAEAWARAAGLLQIASDTEIDNAASVAAHRALGFEEVSRIACFLKKLEP
jgi:aminoglycoside 6'-N-acetyltransferase I